ncbi:MAG: hypothetical protein QTN59_07635 [Candidatus Electrothrix communis]|nr:MAG: hypothetical protein QTN59_07635 [Candidatus Electrothrix communis]
MYLAKPVRILNAAVILSSVLFAYPAMSAITSVSGPNSIPRDLSLEGAPPQIISPPADVNDDAAWNTSMEGFDEQQGITLEEDINVDGGSIAAGTTVSSHMIFLNTGPGNNYNWYSHFDVSWTFDGEVLGVMSDRGGTREVATSELLGAAGTSYPASGFDARGMEGKNMGPSGPGEGYSIADNTLKVGMIVSEPGDWIRVVTAYKKNVTIDIKPGGEPNCFNLNGHGVIPVAILGTENFDPCTEVDPDSLGLLGMSVRVRGKQGPLSHCEDVNADGYFDLVVQFEDDASEWSEGQTSAELTGTLFDGTPIVGTDSICVTQI